MWDDTNTYKSSIKYKTENLDYDICGKNGVKIDNNTKANLNLE